MCCESEEQSRFCAQTRQHESFIYLSVFIHKYLEKIKRLDEKLDNKKGFRGKRTTFSLLRGKKIAMTDDVISSRFIL